MHSVQVQISPVQASKLRNGRKVRIKKPDIEGGGMCLLVEPDRYSLITKTFSRGKGVDLQLTPAEILANQTTPVEGGGIFGRKFDKSVERTLGRRGKKQLYNYASDVLNPLAKGALLTGLAAGATTLGAVQPELIPFLPAGVAGASYFINDYLDKPSAYNKSKNLKEKKSLASKYLEDQALGKINAELGTNLGNLSRSAIQGAIQDKLASELTAAQIEARRMAGYGLGLGLSPLGAGLSPLGAGGSGLYVSGSRRGGSIIGRNGGFIRENPQALQSQADLSNYQFKYRLPIQYQSIYR